ncbi:glycoprotein [Genoa virus]|uniref:Glycoprotein n=1 Tax=Genoa virus TaxID=2485870 RepID=A0A3G3BTJ6_9VIRU|nr:glycoprotein [Genoa virus]AYP67567.1 glycoprotein [Genoa virus]
MMISMVINTWIIMMLINTGETLIGYDCTNKNTNLTAVSLSTVTPCHEDRRPDDEEEVDIQLVQRRSNDLVQIKTCLVERSYLITHCGMHSHSSVMYRGITVKDIIKTSRNQCNMLHDHGTYQLMNGALITGLKVNSSFTTSVVEMGGIGAGGKCHGTSFYLNNHHYESAVMSSSYNFKLMEEHAKLELETGLIRPSSSYAQPFHKREGFDPDLGYIFWDGTGVNEKCSRTSYLVVYEGKAKVFVSRGGTKTLVVNNTDQVMAIGLRDPAILCHQQAVETDHPKLFVVNKAMGIGGFYFIKTQVHPSEVDLFLYTNSKLVYVEQHLSRELTTVFQHFHKRMCEVKHQSLNQLTTLAFMSPEEFAWAYAKRPGVTGVVRGEIVYVVECEPVSVDFRASSRCYQEIPVTMNGTDMFIKPRSRILARFGTEIDCSPIAPPLYLLQGGWVAFTPLPASAPAPLIMTAEPVEKWTYKAVPRLVASGIYSQETLAKYQQSLMFPTERTAITHTISAVIAGMDVNNQHLDSGLLIGQGTFEVMQNSFMTRVYGWWWTLSVNLAGIVGVFYAILFIRAIAATALNGVVLFKTFGLSFKLLAMVWGTLAKYFLFYASKNDQELNHPTPRVDDPETGPSATLYPSLPSAPHMTAVSETTERDLHNERTVKVDVSSDTAYYKSLENAKK